MSLVFYFSMRFLFYVITRNIACINKLFLFTYISAPLRTPINTSEDEKENSISEEDRPYQRCERNKRKRKYVLSDEDLENESAEDSAVNVQKLLRKNHSSEEKNELRSVSVDRHEMATNTSSWKKSKSNLQPSNRSEFCKNIALKKIVRPNKGPPRRGESPVVAETDETQHLYSLSKKNSKYIKFNSFSQIFIQNI